VLCVLISIVFCSSIVKVSFTIRYLYNGVLFFLFFYFLFIFFFFISQEVRE